MKLAVCYSGQLRKLTKRYSKKSQPGENCDIYIHTWDDIHNPNLSKVTEYFPDCYLEVEDYSEFDTLVKDFYNPQRSAKVDNIRTEQKEHFRYSYAQYYTIYKSLKSAVESTTNYDYYHRTRTDIKNVTSILFKPKNYMQSVYQIFNYATSGLLTNTTEELVQDVKKTTLSYQNLLPLAAIDPQVITRDHVLFSDWNFTLNNEAASRLTSLPIHKFLKLVNEIHIESFNKVFSFNPASPFIWKKIFDYFGIVMVPFSDILHKQTIDRGNADATFVKNYGYVDN